jgi:hypothetical protein
MNRSLHALAWQFWAHHWLGFSLLLAYWVPTIVLIGLLPLGSLSPAAAGPIVYLPLILTALYLLGVFTFGSVGEEDGGDSGYPRWLLRMPLRAIELAAAPMVLGAAAFSTLWSPLAWGTIPRLQAGSPPPWLLPLAITMLVWTQVASWWPCRGIWMRCVLFVSLQAIAVGLPALLLFQSNGAWWFAGGLVAMACLAPAAGYFALTRSRQGTVTQIALPGRSFALPSRSQFLLTSARGALVWHDWRRVTIALPAATILGIVLVSTSLPVGWYLEGKVIDADRMFLIFLGIPVFAGFLVGQLAGRFDAASKNATVPTFLAVRPLRAFDFVTAKWISAAYGVAIAWFVTLLIAGTWAAWHRLPLEQIPLLEPLLAGRSSAHTVLAIAALITLLVVASWLFTVCNLCLGLTGRPWLVNVVGLAPAALMIGGVYAAEGLVSGQTALFSTMAWLAWPVVATLICCKTLLAATSGYFVWRKQLMTPRELAALAAAWMLAVAGVVLLLLYVAPAVRERWLPVCAAVVLVIPIARLLACPLALDWNRHR